MKNSSKQSSKKSYNPSSKKSKSSYTNSNSFEDDDEGIPDEKISHGSSSTSGFDDEDLAIIAVEDRFSIVTQRKTVVNSPISAILDIDGEKASYW